MVERWAGPRRIVLGARRQPAVLGRDGEQALEGVPPPRERHPAGLVGEGDRHRRPHQDAQRLDRVQLELVKIVEPVQQHRRRAPQRGRLAQCVQGARGSPLGVGPPKPLKRAAVLLEQLGKRLRAGGVRGVRGRPRLQRLAQTRRGHPRNLQLSHQPRQRAHHTGSRAPGEGASKDRGQHTLAGEAAERPLGAPGAAEHLGEQTLEALHADSQHEPGVGKLAPVVLDVGAGGHDQQRLLSACVMGAQRVQHHPGLAGVGGSGDERNRHGRQ